MRSRSVQLFIAKGFEPLDLAGPISVFSAANAIVASAYSLSTVSLTGAPVRPDAGPAVLPDHTIYQVRPPHTFIIVGGAGIRSLTPSVKDKRRLQALARGAARVASICTGAFLAGRLGLIDGKRVTTHWRYQEELRQTFPDCRLQADRLYSEADGFWSSAGVTAGIDACLAMVTKDHGGKVAAEVARQLVVYLHRPGGQAQYSTDTAGVQIHAHTNRFSELVSWIKNNPKEDLSIPALATRACMSERHFQRRFKQAFGQPVSRFVEQMRISHAREMLKSPSASVAIVASSVGFHSADSFRRSFERVLGVTPSFYRERFKETD
ncbi:MAG: GlxA family transcriptional regulator [Pseudomonadota bacterium]